MVLKMRKMKDSGIEWIGEIPEGWSVSKVLHCLSMPITDGPHTTPILYDTGIPFVSAEAVSCGNGRIDFSHIRGYISEKFYKECCQKYIPEIDDIYMIKSGATTGRVAIVDTTRVFTIWSPLAVFRCNKDCILPKFLFYYLQSPAFQKEVEFGWTFGTQQNVGMRSLEQMKVCVPPLNEQNTIVNHLDYQCAQIDLLLQKALSSIEEYKKLKQAVITQAVTKGVRGEREMKDSGVEWIGEIPAEWSICPLKRLAAIQTGSTPSKTSSESFYSSIAGTPWIKPDNLGFSSSIETTAEFLTEEGCSVARILPSNTVYVGCIGSRIGNCGYSLIPCACNQQINALIFNARMYWKYGWYLTIFQEEQYMLLANGNVIQIINSTTQGNISCIVPSISEQREITAYLDAKCAEIDRLIAKKEQLVKELECYKRSLIYEVVTGKREA